MTPSLLSLLKDQIDIPRVPFSDRGSRLLVFQNGGRSSLHIKLAERLTRIDPGIETYLNRPPFISDLVFIDEKGELLDFKVSTSPEVLRFHTRLGVLELVFQNENTIAIGIPERTTVGIRFRVRPTHWRRTNFGGEINYVRGVAYRVHNGDVIGNKLRSDDKNNASIVEFVVQAQKDCFITLQIADELDSRPEKLLFEGVRENAENRWREWFHSAPSVGEIYRQKYAYAWWVMANNLISPSGYVKYEAMMPTKAFYVGVWLWDSALHAIAFRHIDAELARNQIRVMLAHQLPDGMLPDVVFDDGIVTEIDHPIHGLVTKPPILAWSALKIHETDPNVDFLREIYDPLVRCHTWWFDHNADDKDGLVLYQHPYSSGLDDSPLWDHGMPVKSPDINTYLHKQMNALAGIAEMIGKPKDAEAWRQKAKELLARMIENLWDEEAGLFRAKYNDTWIPVITPFSLYPLWTGELPQEITARLLAHLKDTSMFWGEFGLPTVAYTDPAFNPDKMWRGPTWANVNYFFVEALKNIGEHELANELRDKTLNLIASQPDIREYYNSQSGIPPRTAAPIFGWSAAVFIDLLLMNHTENK
ncbi:MAG TPA: trehalase family glycosidase [Anaerolineales bacterium]|nr:trehalase family glycosidase [Anaerolineales bacterium]